MTYQSTRIVAFGLLTACLAANIAQVSATPRKITYAIIVNRNNPLDQISFPELRKIFLGERSHWPNGRRITLVLSEEESAVRDATFRLLSGMGESDFIRYLLQTEFRGEGSGFKELNSATGVRKFVFNVPGAIGYVPLDEADESVKILKIELKLPGDEGYRLQAILK